MVTPYARRKAIKLTEEISIKIISVISSMRNRGDP